MKKRTGNQLRKEAGVGWQEKPTIRVATTMKFEWMTHAHNRHSITPITLSGPLHCALVATGLSLT